MNDFAETRTDFPALVARISLLAGSFAQPHLGRRGNAHCEARS